MDLDELPGGGTVASQEERALKRPVLFHQSNPGTQDAILSPTTKGVPAARN